MTVPVHELATTEQFLRVLDGYPMKYEPGERFVSLQRRLCGRWRCSPSGHRVCHSMISSIGGCAMPGRHDRHVVPALRTNCPAAPRFATSRTRGCARTCSTSRCAAMETAASTPPQPTSTPCRDALFAGRIVSTETLAVMIHPRSEAAEDSMSYGLRLLAPTTRPVESRSTGSTPASGSSRSAIPVDGSPTPFCPTRVEAPGRSVNA